MDSPPENQTLFVLRLWRERDTSAIRPDPWRIVLSDPKTGRRLSFETLDQLMSYLKRRGDVSLKVEMDRGDPSDE